jgi:hypothetical protein
MKGCRSRVVQRSRCALGAGVVAVEGEVVAEGDVAAEGKARAQPRPSRQPKRVPPLPVVVPHTHRHDAGSRAPRLRTARSGGTRERLSQSGGSVLALRARRGRCRGRGRGRCRGRCRCRGQSPSTTPSESTAKMGATTSSGGSAHTSARRRLARTPTPHRSNVSASRNPLSPRAECAVRAEFLGDAQQLVVLRVAVASARGAGLDLAAVRGDGDVRDRRVLGLA